MTTVKTFLLWVIALIAIPNLLAFTAANFAEDVVRTPRGVLYHLGEIPTRHRCSPVSGSLFQLGELDHRVIGKSDVRCFQGNYSLGCEWVIPDDS